MATYAEIALKVTANVRDAVRGIETVDKALERTDRKIRTISERTRSRLQGAGRVAGGLAQGRSVGDIAEDFLPAAGPAALALEFVHIVQRKLDQYFDKKIADAARRLSEATSVPEASAAFKSGVTADVQAGIKDILKGGAIPGVRKAFDWFTRAVRNEDPWQHETIDNFRALAKSDPALAAALIPTLPANLQPKLWAILMEEQKRAQQRDAFRAGLQPQANVVQQTTNVYQSFSGLGGESNVGREVRAVLDRRDRNNGRYVTPYTRR